MIAIDMLATNAKDGWKRPFYFAMTVPDDYYLGLNCSWRTIGMAYEAGGIKDTESSHGQIAVNTDKASRQHRQNFRWGGLYNVKSADDIYLDEIVRRMVTTIMQRYARPCSGTHTTRVYSRSLLLGGFRKNDPS